MKRVLFITVFVLFGITSLVGVVPAFGAIPQPKARPEVRKAQEEAKQQKAVDNSLEELRRKYPNLNIPASTDVQWVSPTGQGEAADIDAALRNGSVRYSPDRYQEAQEYEDDEHAPTPEELKDAQLAQQWFDVKEDLHLREVDQKALALVKEYAGARNGVPPVQGQNGAVTYTFGDYVPRIVCQPNRITTVALQAGERVTAVHAGDTTRWQISPAKSGSGDGETVHVVIKPLVPDISTNLVIMTDKRAYNLDLISSAKNYIPSARFTYPDDTVSDWQKFIETGQNKRRDEVVLSTGIHNLTPDDLYFGYEILKGKSFSWSPVRVFDDGTKTYIEFPSKYKALEAPVLLFYEGQQQKLVNYRVKDRFYIVDRIMTKKAVLIAGKSRVVIERKKEGK